jgi:methionine biosynthesis protein MetW
MHHETISPDNLAAGFLAGAPDPLRYDGHVYDPYEVAGIISDLVPENVRVLDVGCGAGSLTKLISDRRTKRIIGVEPDVRRSEQARQRGLNVVTGLLDADFFGKNGKFDVLIFADVLEHLPNPQEVLVTARQGLTAGGSVIVSVPNVAHWSVRLNLLRGRFNYESCGIMDATHLRWFTKVSLLQCLAAAGFSVVAYQVTTGVGLGVYYDQLPWRRMRPALRRTVLHSLAGKFPNLFGCQHVAHARPTSYLSDQSLGGLKP